MSDSHGTRGEDWAEARGALWLAELDSYEQMLEPLGIALLGRAALQNGQHIADIGCGGGSDATKAAEFALRAFSFATVLEGAEPGLAEAIRAKVTTFFQQFETPDCLAVPAKAWLLQAAA